MSELRLRTLTQIAPGMLSEFVDLLATAVSESLLEVGASSSGTLGYSAFVDESDGTVVLYEHYADVDAFARHLQVNANRRVRLQSMLLPNSGRIEIYGAAPAQILDQLRDLALPIRHFALAIGLGGSL